MSFQKKPFKRFSTEQISGRLNIQSADGLTCNMPPTQTDTHHDDLISSLSE
ncbi:hypothetical protein [Photorhabdus luminescens]|uniref:hypothetical protein n=1 Tax=Photorhabdus luminescens TaxID=29488 RepID=UPI00223FCFA4|nr:hypothetical protein [Photorhabdus luminescens]MCW7763541.1 hypothetical protein [Photorhabdus luminescens subsp. venezuelensis]